MSSYIDQNQQAYQQGERKAHEDLNVRSAQANLTAWVHIAELIACRIDYLELALGSILPAEERGTLDRDRHEIAGYIAVLRDHLAEQAT